MVSLSGFGVSAAINGGIGLVVFTLFCLFRRMQINRFVYSPRLLHEVNRQGRPPPPPLDQSWFAWIWTVIHVDNKQVLATAGLDAYMFIRVLETFVLMFTGMTILGIGILVPVNYSGQNGQDGFEAISLANIRDKDSRLAAHIICDYIFSAWTYYLLYRLWREYHELRLVWIAQEQVQNRHLTLLVRNIPAAIKNDSVFHSTFESFYPMRGLQSISGNNNKPIHSAFLCKDIGKLDEWVEERDKDYHKLEHALATYQSKPEKGRPTTATRFLCLDKKDALNWFEEEVTRLSEKIVQRKKEALPVYHNGFVTFDSVLAFQTATLIEERNTPFSWRCVPAPELRDIYWPNMSYTQLKRLYMGIAMLVLLYALVIFWTIPVAFVQSVANLQNLSEEISWLSWVQSIPSGALSVIDGFLPGLILTIFNILLPVFLYKMAKLEGRPAWSWLQFRVLDTFFIFQVVNNFLGTTIVTAIAKDPGALFNNLGMVSTILAQTIPGTANFFITFVLFQSFSTYPMMLLNPGGLIVGNLKKRFLVKTARDLVNVEAAPSKDYGIAYPVTLFIFIIAYCFSTLASIILPFTVVYFAFAWFVNKYSFLYVFNTKFETGGRFWPVVFRKIMWCVIVAQLLFTGVLGLKQAVGVTIVSAPLIVAPLFFLFMMERWFRAKSEVLPLDAAVALDEIRQRLKPARQHAREHCVVLDENNQVRTVDYDPLVLRCMTNHDVVFPHGVVTPFVTEKIHRNLIKNEPSTPRSIAARDAATKVAMDAVIHGETDEQRKEAESRPDAPPLIGDIAGSSQDDVHDNDLSAGERTPPLPDVNSPLASGTQAPVLHTMLNTVEHNPANDVHQYRTRHPLLDETILQSRQLVDIPPHFDFIQPSLACPDVLPIPQHVRLVEGKDQSIENDHTIYQEIWREGMMANSQVSPQNELPTRANSVEKTTIEPEIDRV